VPQLDAMWKNEVIAVSVTMSSRSVGVSSHTCDKPSANRYPVEISWYLDSGIH